MLLIRNSLSGTYRLEVKKWISYPMQMKPKKLQRAIEYQIKYSLDAVKGQRSFNERAINLEGENTNSKYICIHHQSTQI